MSAPYSYSKDTLIRKREILSSPLDKNDGFAFKVGDTVNITYYRKYPNQLFGVVLGRYKGKEINNTLKLANGPKQCSVFNDSNLYLVTYVHPDNSPALNDDGDNDGGESGYDVFSEKYLEHKNI